MSELGPTVQRDFEVLEFLGKSGKVLKARQRGLDRLVVLKISNPKFYDPEQARRRFIDEGRLLGSLNDDNVVQVYGVEEPPGEDPFLVMEYVEGVSLKQLLKKQGSLSYQEATDFMAGICQALEAIHARGIVHRNLKPENLLVDNEGRIKLVDFGLALDPESSGEEGGDVVLGTPIYMSPEQVRGKELDTRSDVYAAGVIFYELLTGKPPFLGREPRAIMKAHVKKPVPDPAERGKPLPSAVMHVLRRALAKKPGERYESATKLRERVQALRSVSDDPGELSTLLRRRDRRRSKKRSAGWKRTLGGLGALALVAGVAWFWREAARVVDTTGPDVGRVRAEAQGTRLEVRWKTVQEAPTHLEYGYSDPPTMVHRRDEPVLEHRVELTELQPGRRVYFRVGLDGGAFSPVESRLLATAWSLSGVAADTRAVSGTVRVRTAYEARPWIEFSPDPELQTFRKRLSPAAGTEHAIELGHLKANTTYHARLILEEPGRPREWQEFRFRTREVEATQVHATPERSPFGVAPLVVEGLVVVGSDAGRLQALARPGGAVLWDVDAGAPVRGELAPLEGAVGARVGDRTLAAFAREDGRELWRVELSAAVVGSPAQGEGVLVAALADGELVAVHAATGARLWTRRVGAVPSASPGIGSVGGTFELVCGFEDGVVRGFGPGGRPRWQQPFGARTGSAPVHQGVGVALVGGDSFVRMRESRKAPRWTLDPGGGAYAVVLEDRTAVVATREEGLVAYDWDSGRSLWERELPGGARGRPRIREGRVYVAGGEGAVHCVARADGALLWSSRLGAGVIGGPVPAAEGCYVATAGGQLYRFED